MAPSKIADSSQLPPQSIPAPHAQRKKDVKRAMTNLSSAFARLGRARGKTSWVAEKSEDTRAPESVAPKATVAAAQPMRAAPHPPVVPGQGERAANELIGKIRHFTLAATEQQLAVHEAPLQAFAHPRTGDNKLAIDAATESYAYAPESDVPDRMVVAMMTIERTLQAADQSAPSRQRIKASIGHAMEIASKMELARRTMLAPFLAQAYVQVGGEAQLHRMVAHVAQAADPALAAHMQVLQAVRRGLGKDDARAEAFMEESGVQDFVRGGAVDLALMGMARKQGIVVPSNHFGRGKLAAQSLKQQLGSLPEAQVQAKPAMGDLSRAVNRVLDAMDQGKKATLEMLAPALDAT